MAGKSTNSNETENSEDGDSPPDSEALKKNEVNDVQNEDAPVVIEGEAEDVIEDTVENSEPTDEQKDYNDDANSAFEEEITEAAEGTQLEPTPVAAAVPEKQGSVVPLVFGGLVAGAIGYGASYFDVLKTSQTAEISEAAMVDTSAIDARIDALASEVAGITPTSTDTLSDRIDALAADLVELQSGTSEASMDLPDGVVARLEALDADVSNGMSELTDRIAGLEDRLTDMQMAQESGTSSIVAEDELAAFQSKLDALTADATAQVEEAKARASEFEKEAAKAAAVAERQSALAVLTSAVESGSPFNEELSFFSEPPEALAAVAEKGLPTLGSLQRDFPNAARAALSVATVVPQDASAGERFTAFLKLQTNARSLAPQEGDGTDAVLSRAEASVAQGDLEGSLAELSSLSDEAKEVLGPWMANAQSRLDALSALSELSAAVN